MAQFELSCLVRYFLHNAMKIQIIIAVLAAALFLMGCGQLSASSSTSGSSATESVSAAPAVTPVAWAAMTAWQQGDKTTAINDFLKAGWSARPLFPSSSMLSLTEAQYRALAESGISNAALQAKFNVMISQLQSLNQVAMAVDQIGRDAVAKGDNAKAQKYFTSVQQCGTALDSPDCMLIVQLRGHSIIRVADEDLATIGQ
ncbi:MAG TPA: hypothetical protein VMG59_05485 [Phycisphaerae bacterium]|nr:hypothetical protein [Phycisphaerae bacterium]